MKRNYLGPVLAILLVCVSLPLIWGAEQKQSDKPELKDSVPAPTALEILQRFAKEIGGQEAFSKHSSQHAKGTVEMPGQNLTGNMEVFAARPNKLKMVITMQGLGAIVTAFDGTIGWMVNPLIGPMLLEGKMLDQIKSEADFDHTLHNPDDYKVMDYQGKEDFGGEECYKLHLVHKTGFDSIEYFAVKSGLQKGFVATQDTPLGPVKATTLVSDYKHFGDLFVPSKMTQSVSGMQSVMTITEMEYDTVPKDAFDPPVEIKALLQAPKEAPGTKPEPNAPTTPQPEKKP